MSSLELAEVILAIATELDALPPDGGLSVVDRTSYARKNVLNNMSSDFANLLQKNYSVHLKQIASFLADPQNAEALSAYDSAALDFQFKIVAKRQTFQSFDDVFNHLFDTVTGRDSVLSSNRQLTRAVLYFMYWSCDIGESDEDTDAE